MPIRKERDWRCSSVVTWFLSMLKVLGSVSVPGTQGRGLRGGWGSRKRVRKDDDKEGEEKKDKKKDPASRA